MPLLGLRLEHRVAIVRNERVEENDRVGVSRGSWMLPSALRLRVHHRQVVTLLLRALSRTEAKVRARAAYVDVSNLLESDWGVASSTSVAAVIELRVGG